jgi:hypothetical protein
MQVTIHPGSMPVPAGAEVFYEAEWNEEATAEDHRCALIYFASKYGIAVEDIPGAEDIPVDDPDWYATVNAGRADQG